MKYPFVGACLLGLTFANIELTLADDQGVNNDVVKDSWKSGKEKFVEDWHVHEETYVDVITYTTDYNGYDEIVEMYEI